VTALTTIVLWEEANLGLQPEVEKLVAG